ncbi:nuclear transport factor 2 family protein [Minwuia thermotolerans]|uniref:nuclear transport factor 2 family protein n=1 Tax=Minwuia thermotolerans TaxID=2056226 RepID=UPI0013DDE1C4|nr:nuclear transport factor 2 family protein [Minwuia thermotolerans]
MVDFDKVLKRFTDAVESNDGAGLAALFAEDGVYHDYIYGPFEGRERIAHMLSNHFWGDAKDFSWQMIDPVCDGRTGYARYLFSFISTMPAFAGNHVLLEGTSIFIFGEDGLIESYRETANGAAAMVQLGVPPEVMAAKSRKWAKELRGRAEAAGHVAAGRSALDGPAAPGTG